MYVVKGFSQCFVHHTYSVNGNFHYLQTYSTGCLTFKISLMVLKGEYSVDSPTKTSLYLTPGQLYHITEDGTRVCVCAHIHLCIY